MDTKHHCPFLEIALVHGYPQYAQQNENLLHAGIHCKLLVCQALCKRPQKMGKTGHRLLGGLSISSQLQCHDQSQVQLAVEAQWFAFLQTPQEALGWQVICDRWRHEASCQLLAAEAWNISSTSRYKPWGHGGTNAYMTILSTLRSDVYHLLPKCHVQNNIRTMFLAVDCWWPNFLKFHI